MNKTLTKIIKKNKNSSFTRPKKKIKLINSSDLHNQMINNNVSDNDISSIYLQLLSEEDVLRISSGEVQNTETLHYRTLKPIKGGLFCESIFGPKNNFSCSCNKYNGSIFENVTCEECGVTVTKSNVRRERLGHITLNVPLLHSWYYISSANNPITQLLCISHKTLLKIIFFHSYLKFDVDYKDNFQFSVLDETQFKQLNDEEKSMCYSGSQAILYAFENLDLNKYIQHLKDKYVDYSHNQAYIIARNFIASNQHPKNLVLKNILVLPADLRPIIPLPNGIFGTTELNFLYKLLILRNSRYKDLQNANVPDIMLRHSQIILQRALDMLIDNSKLKTPLKMSNKILKSLTEVLRGKEGILRTDLLGKRVDFSARSVIVVDPKLKLNQCGIPKFIAVELFKPIIIQKLLKDKNNYSIIESLKKINSMDSEVLEILNSLIVNRSIIINRAPSLHKHSMQAFDIVIVEGLAIKIHPLVCAGFNADFDGDQVSIYLSIISSSTLEAKLLMSSKYNIFSNANGSVIVQPVSENILGCYLATYESKKLKQKNTFFNSIQHVKNAYYNNMIHLREEIEVYIDKKVITTTVGRILFNEILPEDVRNYGIVFNKQNINKIVKTVYDRYDFDTVAILLDKLKELGFQYSTEQAVSFSLKDLKTPSKQNTILDDTWYYINILSTLYEQKFLLFNEWNDLNINIWENSIQGISKNLKNEATEENDLYLSILSGARGKFLQARQLSAVRGLMNDADGTIFPHPILQNFKVGLTPYQYFISSFGSRKSIVDKGIETAKTGYLARCLIDSLHNIIIKEYDCGTQEDSRFEKEEFYLTISRVVTRDVVANGNIIIKQGEVVDENTILELNKNQVDSIHIRTIFNCKSDMVCSMCYGWDLAKRNIISVGSAAGIVAAQSIGEPATQLTLRTFHTGGIFEDRRSEEEKTLLIIAKQNCNIDYNFNVVKIHPKVLLVVEDGNLKVLYSNDNIVTFSIKKGSILFFDKNENINKHSIIGLNFSVISYINTKKGTVSFDSSHFVNEVINQNNVLVSTIATQLQILDNKNNIIETIDILPKTHLLVSDKEKVKQFTILGKKTTENRLKHDIVDQMEYVKNILDLKHYINPSILSSSEGTIDIKENQQDKSVRVDVIDKNGQSNNVILNIDPEMLLCYNGQYIKIGERLTHGEIDFNHVSNLFNSNYERSSFILTHVLKTFEQAEISINRKHFEILINNMFNFSIILDSGDSDLSVNDIYSTYYLKNVNQKLIEQNLTPINYKNTLCGMNKMAMNNSSFLSSASFKDAKKVLSNAAIKSLKDDMEGLKSNIITGNLIPAGTGSRQTIDLKHFKICSNTQQYIKHNNLFYFVNRCINNLNNILEDDVNFLQNSDWVETLCEYTLEKINKDIIKIQNE